MSHGTTSANPGQLSEINSAVDRAMPKAIAAFNPKDVIAGVQNGEMLEQHMHNMFAALLAKSGRKSATPSSPTFKRDMHREENWTLLEDSGRNPELTLETIPNLIHIPFLKDGDGDWISGGELVIRARDELKANWGQQDAEFLLENQHLIPKSFCGKYILCTGTIWQYRSGSRLVACLRWDGDGWFLCFRNLGSGYSGRSALPGLRK